MASFSIQTRTPVNGKSRFKATVTVKKNSYIIHREANTFKKKEHARTRRKNRKITGTKPQTIYHDIAYLRSV